MMKFEEPNITIVKYSIEDVITTSCPAYDPNAGEEDEF